MSFPLLSLVHILSLYLAMCQSSSKGPQATIDHDTSTLINRKTPVSDSLPGVSPYTTQYNLSYIMGHFDPASHPDFVLIDTIHADRSGLYLHKDTYSAFRMMYKAAHNDGIQLQIRSATRNFIAQKNIWEGKWTGETLIENGQNASIAYPDPVQRATMILKYSSMPGSSRHHWGTDIDLNAFDNTWFESGNGLQLYQWLSQNASRFGFCQPYCAKGKNRPYGYEEERWHWSYMPLSQQLSQMAADSLKDSMIAGFMGSEVASQLNIVERYVLGINVECEKVPFDKLRVRK